MVQIKGEARQAIAGESIDEYLSLVRAFPLVSVRDDAHLDAAVAVIDTLSPQGDPLGGRGGVPERAHRSGGDLRERTRRVPPQTSVDALRSLIEENGLTQQDLAPVFGAQSIVSEVLGGKRTLTVKHIEKLAAYFHVSPAVFFDDVPAQA